MKKATMMLVAVMAVSGLAACTSQQMMMSDRSMMMNDGRMMMSESNGTSRVMTDAEMNDHMTMMMRDPRVSSMMMDGMKNDSQMSAATMDKCRGSMASSSASSGGERMMVMNSDGSTREATDAELRSRMKMMMKNSQMAKMMSDAMMAKCSAM